MSTEEKPKELTQQEKNELKDRVDEEKKHYEWLLNNVWNKKKNYWDSSFLINIAVFLRFFEIIRTSGFFFPEVSASSVSIDSVSGL